MGRIFDLGVRKGHTILNWGYAEGYNFDLGVRGYQKVEKPWSSAAQPNLVPAGTRFFRMPAGPF
jgi:hypothetical protein